MIKQQQNKQTKTSVVVHACNLNSEETMTGRFLRLVAFPVYSICTFPGKSETPVLTDKVDCSQGVIPQVVLWPPHAYMNTHTLKARAIAQ